MSTHKHIDKICCVAIALALVLTVIFMNAESLGVQASATAKGYETRLFDTQTVHTIDIVMDDWDSFIETCTNEEYTLCSVVIDGEAYKNVGIRAKGNTSLTQVASYGNDRYSFKIEFDHYDNTKTYYGLDKLSLNNIIQDNTYMKDYLTYQMMGYFGVDAPLCSYVYITVNGEEWGLYVAVEGVEEAFLERNYGSDYGELYKPDSQSMGGGRGNGGQFNMEDWQADADGAPQENGFSDRTDKTQRPDMPERGGMGGMMGSDDVSLIYTDDEYSSYQNIFDNAKTDITDADKDRLIASLKQLNAGENIESVVDVDEVIRYFVVHNFVCNFDSYTGSMIHNYYLYEEDGQLSMIPWDYNLAFGGFQGAQDASALVNYPIDTPVSGGTVDSRPMLAWIFANEEYTQLYHEYFAEFIAGYFDSGYFAQMIDSVYEMIASYVEKDPTKFCTYDEFEAGIATLKEFCLLRAQSISGQLEGAIPSTSDGQQQDDSALVDASDIDISAMGSMNNGMGGMGRGGFQQMGQEQPQAFAQAPDSEQTPTAPDQTPQALPDAGQTETAPEAPPGGQAPDDFTGEKLPSMPQEGDNAQQMPDWGSNGMMRPDRQIQGEGLPEAGIFEDRAPNTAAVQTDSVQSWVWLGVCVLVLAGGIAVAALYKKRV